MSRLPEFSFENSLYFVLRHYVGKFKLSISRDFYLDKSCRHRGLNHFVRDEINVVCLLRPFREANNC